MIRAGRKPLPPLATRVLVGEVAREARGYFRPVAHTPGFADSLHRLFRELAQAGLSPEGFRAAGGAVAADGAGINRRKHADLADLYDRYADRRASHYGPDDCLAVADPGRLGAEALLVYGVWDPPARLRTAIEAIVAAGTPLTAFLPEGGVMAADGAHAEMRGWLAGIGASTDAATGDGAAPEPPPTLGHLQRGLFRTDEPQASAPSPTPPTPPSASSPPPTPRARSAPPRARAWSGRPPACRFYAMAVAYRQGEQYRPLVEATFREAGIPIYLDEGTPIAERPLGRRALALLELVGSGLERRAVMDFLTDADLPAETRARYGGVSAPRWDGLSAAPAWSRARAVARPPGRPSRARGGALRRRRVRRAPARMAPRPPGRHRAPGALRRRARPPARRRPPQTRRSRPTSTTCASSSPPTCDDADPILDALAPLAKLDALARPIDFARFREIVASCDREPAQRGRARRARRDVRPARGERARREHPAPPALRVRRRGRAGRALLPPSPAPGPAAARPRARGAERARRRRGSRCASAAPTPSRSSSSPRCRRPPATPTSPTRARVAARAAPQLPSSFFRAAAEALVGESVPAEKVDRLALPCFTRESAGRDRRGRRRPPPSRPTSTTAPCSSRAPPSAARCSAARTDFARAREVRPRPPRDRPPDPLRRRARAVPPPRPWPSTRRSPARCRRRASRPTPSARSASSSGACWACPRSRSPRRSTPSIALNRGSLVHRVLERFLMEQTAAGDAPRREPARRAPGPPRADRPRGVRRRPRPRARPATRCCGATSARTSSRTSAAGTSASSTTPTSARFDRGAYEVRFGPSRHEPDTDRAGDRRAARIETAGGRELLVQGRIDRLNWTTRRAALPGDRLQDRHASARTSATGGCAAAARSSSRST